MENNSKGIPNNVFKKIILIPCDIAAQEFATVFFSGQPVQLEYNETSYVSDVMIQTIKNFAGIIDTENKPSYDLEIAKEHLIRAFIYFFDKSIEIVYNIRVDNEKSIKFKIDDLYSGWGGNKIPEYLQVKVTKIVPHVGVIFNKTIKYLIDNKYFDQYTFFDLTEVILFGAVMLGSEFCKRLDLNDESEYIKLLES